MQFADLKFEPTENNPFVSRAIFTSIWGRSACFRIETPKSNLADLAVNYRYEIMGDYGNHPPQFSNVHYKNLTATGVQVILDAVWRPEGWKPFTQADAEALSQGVASASLEGPAASQLLPDEG